MNGLVVAADGGNSKTDLVVAEAGGAVLARVAGAGTHPVDEGVGATADGLVELTRRALAQAGLAPDSPLRAGAFYLANVDLADERAAMTDALATRGLADRLVVENDTLAVLRAGSSAGWGIAVVSGAGINAVGRAADGRIERFLGLGPVTGDWGGGWAVAVAGIGAAVRAGDGRGPATSLRRLVRETFGADAEPVAVAVHRRELPVERVLGFGPVVFAAATAGDQVACGVVRRLGDEVVGYVEALSRRLGEPAVEVVLGGGALQAGNPVLDGWIRDRVAAVVPGAVVRVLDVPPVAGALAAALKLAGVDASTSRARAALRTVPTAAAT